MTAEREDKIQKKVNRAHIKAILFDLDGVLIDSYAVWYHLFNDALRHFGFKQISNDIFHEHWGQSTEEDVRIFMQGRTVEEVRTYFQSHFSNYVKDIQVDPSAQNILRALSRSHLKLACVTNSHKSITRQILELHDLAKYFDIIITADDVHRPKPAPDMLLKACEFLKVNPEHTVFTGDTLSDKQAGNAAGCIFIGYKLNTDIAIDNLDDLYSLLVN